jgi:hypothetical protein
VRSSLIRHSHKRSTLHPSFRRRRATLRSLRRFHTILDFQNARLLFDGRLHREHPCQKHPSTNSATSDLAMRKSGFPATGHCFLNPSIPRLRSRASILRSVVPPMLRDYSFPFHKMCNMETWNREGITGLMSGISQGSVI